MIDPVLRANVTPIAPFDLPAAFSSSSRLSSSGIHGLLLFFGMRADNPKGVAMFNLFNIVMTRRFLVPSVDQRNKVSPVVLGIVQLFGDGGEYLTSRHR
jgi:hypothetical protein